LENRKTLLTFVQNINMEEIWKEIENSTYYFISTQGRVKSGEHLKWCVPNNSYSTIKEKILIPSTNNSKGYERIDINYKDKISKTESVHRLVAKAFIPNPNNLPQVNHIDGIKTHNWVDNLEWCSNQYNMLHSLPRRRLNDQWKKISGEKCTFNLHSEEKIRQIPDLIKKGHSYKEVATILNIPPTLITEIKSGRAWKRLNLEIPDSPKYKRKI
jgi:hypothetical protein